MIVSPFNLKVRPCAAYRRQIINYLVDMRNARIAYATWLSGSEINVIDNQICYCESYTATVENISRHPRSLAGYLINLDLCKTDLLRRVGRRRR